MAAEQARQVALAGLVDLGRRRQGVVGRVERIEPLLDGLVVVRQRMVQEPGDRRGRRAGSDLLERGAIGAGVGQIGRQGESRPGLAWEGGKDVGSWATTARSYWAPARATRAACSEAFAAAWPSAEWSPPPPLPGAD